MALRPRRRLRHRDGDGAPIGRKRTCGLMRVRRDRRNVTARLTGHPANGDFQLVSRGFRSDTATKGSGLP